MLENQREKRGKLFRKAVESLGLDSPTTEISDRLSYDKGNLSRVLNNKLQPSTTLIREFERAYGVKIEDFKEAVNQKDPPASMEDLLANRLLEKLMPIVNKVLESHQKIIKELLQQGLEIDELLDEVQELKETTATILEEVKHSH